MHIPKEFPVRIRLTAVLMSAGLVAAGLVIASPGVRAPGHAVVEAGFTGHGHPLIASLSDVDSQRVTKGRP